MIPPAPLVGLDPLDATDELVPWWVEPPPRRSRWMVGLVAFVAVFTAIGGAL